MPTIQNKNGDILIISGRTGMKYIDKNMKEYYINSEMVISEEYDFAIFPESLKYYDDYEKEVNPNNIDYHEEYNEEKGCGTGKIVYKKKYISNISTKEREIIFKKITELCKQGNIKIEIL